MSERFFEPFYFNSSMIFAGVTIPSNCRITKSTNDNTIYLTKLIFFLIAKLTPIEAPIIFPMEWINPAPQSTCPCEANTNKENGTESMTKTIFKTLAFIRS